MKVFNPLIQLAALAVLAAASVSCSSNTDRKGERELKGDTLEYVSPRTDSSLFSLLDLDYPGMEKVRKAVRSGDFTAAKAEYLAFRREKSSAKWHINPADKPLKPSGSGYPGADLIMMHRLAASRNAPEAFLGDDIDWKYNPVPEDQPHFTKEWTWGMNRMYFWDDLGNAYWQTLDEKYAVEWVEQMRDWVEDNPVPLEADPGSTLNWRTIESGIRMARSWTNAYYYFLNSPSFTPDAHADFIRGIIEHGEKLHRTCLYYPKRSGNWVTMESNGLGTVGILFPELRMSGIFRKVAFERLNAELDKQVYPDGAEIELTPHYHQVSLYNFMRMAKLAILNNVSLPDGYTGKMKKMFEFNLYIMDPMGYLPPFNDAHRQNITKSYYEVCGLMEAYDIWKDEKFRYGATLGKEGTKPEYDSYFFNWAGYYVMRSGWNKNDNCLYFDAGPVGSGHEHEDMLNLYLYSHGKILLNEDSYSYDKSEWRKFALSTAAHNTITVDGKEQHRGDIPGERIIKEPLKNPWISSPVFDYGQGTYASGYQASVYRPVQFSPKEYTGRKDSSVTHTRSVIFLKPYYYVAVDFLEGSGEHKYEAHFNLDAPGARINSGTKAATTLRTDTVQLALYPMNAEKMNARIAKGEMNPILGWLAAQRRAIPTVVYSKTGAAPVMFSTLIYPYYGEEPKVSYNSLMRGKEGWWGEQISTPHEKIALALKRTRSAVSAEIASGIADPFTTDAELTVLRKPGKDAREFYGFYGVKAVDGKYFSFRSPEAVSFVIARDNNSMLVYNPQAKDIVMDFSIPLSKNVTLPAGKWMSVTSAGITEYAGQVSIF